MQSTVFCLCAFMLMLFCITKPLGLWIEPIACGRAPAFAAGLDERIMRLANVSNQAQNWLQYACSLLMFNVAGFVLLYAILRCQGFLPFNPQGFAGMDADQALNTAISFVTNTNWQSYGGESTLSHLSQCTGLAVQNFVSSATGICVAFVLMRGFARHETDDLGNFRADIIRVNLWLLLPICFAYALFLVSQGVVQTFSGDVAAATLAGGEQSIALGPVASQEAIKMLGTNGGGFFNANSSHPFENPTQISNFVECISILAISSALVYVLGRMVGNVREGWAVWGAMAFVFVFCVLSVAWFESASSPALTAEGALPMEMNMEGKEMRFDLASTSLFTAATTAASCGAVNAMHDSLTPLAGMVPLLLIDLGEVIFGGVGAGFYGVMVFAVVSVFIAGLMVGRTPEYLGKKITPLQMKPTCMALLTTPVLVLCGTAIACLVPECRESLNNAGAHGFSEYLYAFSSASNNNGSAFAGLNADTWFFNTALAVCMWLGRFVVIIAVLALAGTLGQSRHVPASAGTMPTSGVLFAGLLVGVIVLVGALTYIPAVALGGVAEYLAL